MDSCYWVSSRPFTCFLIIYTYFIFSSSSLRFLDYLHFFKIFSVSLNSLINGSFAKNYYFWVTSWSFIFYLIAFIAFLLFSSSSSIISNYLHFFYFFLNSSKFWVIGFLAIIFGFLPLARTRELLIILKIVLDCPYASE